MGKKIFSWTVSVIAILERDDHFQWEAYEEFERSITTLKSINKDIGFSIYLYDVKDLTAYTKKSKIFGGKYHLELTGSERINNFYGNNFQHIIDFLAGNVAKKKLKKKETHRHFLITWGHGTGIGFFAQKDKSELRKLFTDNKLDSKKDEDNLLYAIQKIRFLRTQLSLNDDQINIRKLLQNESLFDKRLSDEGLIDGFTAYVKDNIRKCVSAIELGDIIKEGLKDDVSAGDGPQVDFLLCLTCYTQMIETGFALKDVVKIMVAPETTISHFGYNYKKLFRLLTRKPAATETQVANCLVNTYLAKYESEYMSSKIKRGEFINGIEYRRLVSFNVIRLRQYEEVARAIAAFVQFILSPANTVTICECNNIPAIDALRKARLRCLETSYPEILTDGNGVVDFNNLFMRFCEFYPVSEFENINGQYSDIRKTYDEPGELILAQYYPAYYSGIREEERIMSLNAGFFGIFLPKTNGAEARESGIYEILSSEIALPGSFWQQTGWNQLIQDSSV
jgi:hypothetical protein